MNKIEEIFKAWNISFNPNDNQSELALKRIDICNSCEYKVTNLGINRCSVCGCALKGKVFSPVKGACPKGKWDGVDNIEIKTINDNIVRENYIYKVDNLIDDSICDTIFDFYNKNYVNDLNDVTKLPWFEENIVYWRELKNTDISEHIGLCREKIKYFIEKSYQKNVFPNTSTLVMWKKGKSMAIHKDNGYDNDKELLHMRKYTAVLYINDNFEGGETVVLKQNSNEPEIVNKPKKGSLIVFRSDDSCLHGVNKILKGNRLTLSMWFTTDEKYSEL